MELEAYKLSFHNTLDQFLFVFKHDMFDDADAAPIDEDDLSKIIFLKKFRDYIFKNFLIFLEQQNEIIKNQKKSFLNLRSFLEEKEKRKENSIKREPFADSVEKFNLIEQIYKFEIDEKNGV